MTSATTWNRIEPRVRGDSLSSLEARIYDPMWLLARQWQVGEFTAEDAGTPIAVTLRGSVGMLSHVARGASRPGVPYSPLETPLEAVIEAEPAVIAGQLDLRSSARAGTWWWAELDRNGLGAYREQYLSLYPLQAPGATADAASVRTAGVLCGRVCDGLAVAAALAHALASGSLPPAPAFAANEVSAATTAAQAFLARLGASAPASPTAWAGTRLEYRAAVAGIVSNRECALVAPEHRGGALDWYAFDLDSAGGVIPKRPVTPGPPVPPRILDFSRSFQPQPARFPGMPRARYWELEDGDVNFGAVETGPTDLTRLLLLEYALIYGNDYFLVPLSLPLGSLCALDEVIVTDTFGGTWAVPSVASVDGAAGGFKLFSHAPADDQVPANPASVLLVPPTSRAARAGRPLERVRLVRDEPAEMAWALEETVQGAAGRPIQRAELAQAARQANPPAPSGNALQYRIMTSVPPWWIPLVPEQTSTTAFALRVRVLVDIQQAPLGRLVVVDSLLADEEVPRTGIEAQRVARRARWIGGGTSTWCARRVRPGRVEGSSGLAWDNVNATP